MEVRGVDLVITVRFTDIRRAMEVEHAHVATAITAAMQSTAGQAKAAYRSAVAAAGLGKWRNAIGAKTYPENGASTNPLAVIGPRSSKDRPKLEALIEGATIRGRDGLFLAIPTAAAPKRGTGGRKISPATFPEGVYGPLRFVYRRNGPSLLVVDNQRARIAKRTGALRGFKRAGAAAIKRGAVSTVVMFLLVRQVRLPRRFAVADLAVRAQAELAAQIADRLGKAD